MSDVQDSIQAGMNLAKWIFCGFVGLGETLKPEEDSSHVVSTALGSWTQTMQMPSDSWTQMKSSKQSTLFLHLHTVTPQISWASQLHDIKTRLMKTGFITMCQCM
jgi:hypothetical protein